MLMASLHRETTQGGAGAGGGGAARPPPPPPPYTRATQIMKSGLGKRRVERQYYYGAAQGYLRSAQHVSAECSASCGRLSKTVYSRLSRALRTWWLLAPINV
jgi:hypothetical protein